MTDEYPPPGSAAIGAPPRLRHDLPQTSAAGSTGQLSARHDERLISSRSFVVAGLLGLTGVAALVCVLARRRSRRPAPDRASAILTIVNRADP